MSSIGDLIELGNSQGPEGIRVWGLVPGQFEAYVLILHPAWADASRDRQITWAEIAAVSGARLDGTVAFRRITVSPGSDIPLGPQGSWDEDATPLRGTLPERETNALLDLLTPSTACWFVMWDGWDGLRLTLGRSRFCGTGTLTWSIADPSKWSAGSTGRDAGGSRTCGFPTTGRGASGAISTRTKRTWVVRKTSWSAWSPHPIWRHCGCTLRISPSCSASGASFAEPPRVHETPTP
jgi:hypothetical protein